MREARIAAALHHPHIVSIFDVVLEDGEPWLILEYLPSRSLGSILGERGTLPPTDVAAIGAQVAAALAAAHEAGVVHRDVKPDNILVARRSAPGNTGPLVKLTDFGISHAATVIFTAVFRGPEELVLPTGVDRETMDGRDIYRLPVAADGSCARRVVISPRYAVDVRAAPGGEGPAGDLCEIAEKGARTRGRRAA
jgi:serine/threonine protein kinase